jgi:hypothetical protein
MCRVDISAFFRHVGSDPGDGPLLVIFWDFGDGPEPVVDTRMPFGLRHSPELCCRLSRAVLGALRRRLRARGIEMGNEYDVFDVVDD